MHKARTMKLAGIRLLLCAIIFSTVPQLHPQTATAPHAGSWKVVYEENFEGPAPFPNGPPAWAPDTFQTLDEYSDGGPYFAKQGIVPPVAYRAEAPFSKDG